MRICFIPIDNRPVCYSLAKDIAGIDEDLELFIPPREFLGDLKKTAQIDKILDWMKEISSCDVMVLALDTLLYGGLVPSRRCPEGLNVIEERLEKLIPLLAGKKVYAVSSIMRISNNNYNEEEKEYWAEYGKKIFEYSWGKCRPDYIKLTSLVQGGGKCRPDYIKPTSLVQGGGKCRPDYIKLTSLVQTEEVDNNGIPKEILEDYLQTRERNFEINKKLLRLQKEGYFNKLVFSKDDCAEFGFNVEEARELERLGGFTKTGADEIPLSLLASAIEKEIKVFVEFIEEEYKDRISNYEDVSIEKSVEGQLELGGFKRVFDKDEADIVLIVNNFIEKQGELIMGWDTKPFDKDLVLPNKPYCIADVRYANGADNSFVEQVLSKIDLDNFYGYSGWNTSANALGSLLAGVKVKWGAKKYNDKAFRRFQMIRFLDDWAYQANVRKKDIALMKPFEARLTEVLGYKTTKPVEYLYPWDRSFEIEVCIN